jgi:hypothetical protein
VFSTAVKKRVTTRLLLFGERVKRAFRTAGLEVARDLQEAADVLIIIVFQRSAKDFPSVLRLYCIEHPLDDK